MSLLIPESGLLFWMLVSFGIVVVILIKYGFPIIINMVEERRAYIDESLVFAQKAHQEMLNLKAEGEVIVENARREHTKILHEANKMREAMIKDAKKKAQIEGEKILTDAKNQILIEKEDAIRAIRRQVAELSLDIAERVVRKKLDGEEEQMNMINRLLDEINISKS